MSSPTSFRQLEVFLEAVEAGSFRACGDKLGISQASVSTHIKALENRLGGELFTRRRGAVAGLTERGGRTYREVKDLMERAERLGLQTRTLRPGGRRNVTIGAHGLPGRLLSRALPRFAAEHTELNIVLEVIQYERLVDELKAGRMDIGYFVSDGPALELESRRIRTEFMSLYVSPRHPLAALATVTPGDLAASKSIGLPENTHLRTVVDRAVTRAGLPVMPMAMESDQIDVVKQAAILGLGAAWLFKMSVGPELASGVLQRVALDIEVPVEIHQTVAPRHQRDRQIQGIVDYLEREVFSMAGDPRGAVA